MKVSLKGYFSPTPSNIKMAADAVLATALFLETNAVGSIPENWKHPILICCVVAKLLTNFFVTSPADNGNTPTT